MKVRLEVKRRVYPEGCLRARRISSIDWCLCAGIYKWTQNLSVTGTSILGLMPASVWQGAEHIVIYAAWSNTLSRRKPATLSSLTPYYAFD